MTKKETIDGLKYIADSPSRENGGFHPTTVKIAKSAIKLIEAKKMTPDQPTIRAFLDFYGYRETCKKCGIAVYRMIDKRVQPHLLTIDLIEHNHTEPSTPKVKKMIETERRAPGGDW